MHKQINPCIPVDKFLIDLGYTLLDTSKQQELSVAFKNLLQSLKRLPAKPSEEVEIKRLINKLFEEFYIIQKSACFLLKEDIKESYSLLFSKTVSAYLRIISD